MLYKSAMGCKGVFILGKIRYSSKQVSTSYSGISLLSLSSVPSVSGQGRFVDSLVKLRSNLDPEKFK